MVINKLMVKKLLALALVSGGTAVVTWNVAKSRFLNESDEKVMRIRDYYRQQLDLERQKSELSVKYSSPIKPEDVNPVEEEEDEPKEERTPYNRLLKDYGTDQFVTQTESRSPVVEGVKELHPKSRPPIHILSEEEYLNVDDPDFPYQEKESAIYYEEDDVATDQYGEVIEDYTRLFGTDFLSEFRKGSKSNGELAYVRNTQLKMDWEIELRTGAYHELVLGYHAEPVKRRNPKFRDDD